MSVLGIDVGNATSVVALARRNGIDVVLNSESKRETASMVNFSSKQRFIGVAAAEKVSMEPKNTVGQLKRLLGKRSGDAELTADIPTFNFGVSDEAGVPVVRVQYAGEQKAFRAEQLLAALLGELKAIGEKDQGAKITDTVLSIPGFFTEQQRRAVLDAASIAGLNVLRLIHETTATALAYGIYKTDLPADKPQHVAFIDAGHSSLQVAVVAFTKAGLKVLGYGFDRNFGGRNFDEALFNHYAEEFKTKTKLDVKANPRASLRLRLACEKTKKVLSSNPECPFSIECLMNDTDFKAHATREQFEQLAQPLLHRVLDPVQTAMADAGLSPEDISAVEIVGGASRLPALCKAVEEFFSKPLRRTMNATESVARGCALQGAMLSPTFHVTRRFEVEDVCTYPVAFSWAASEDAPQGERTTSLVFPKGNPMPSAKMLTFFRSGVFPLEADLAEPAMLPAGCDAHVASFEIGPLPPPKAGGKSKLKVKARVNLHGCVSVESAVVVEEQEVEDATGDAAKMDEDAADTDAAAAAANGATPMDADVKKKAVTKTEVPVVARAAGLPPPLLRELTEKEFEMALQDRVMEETKERKNALEAYVLRMRSALSDNLAPFATDAVKADFNAQLQKAEDWLYDEGEDESKGVYISRLDALKAVGDPIEERAKEAAAREPAAAALRRAAETLLAAADDAKYAHIEAAQLDSLRKEASAALAWLTDKSAQQAALPKTATPALLSRDCVKKQEALERMAKPILATPKPAPPPPSADAAAPMDADAPPPNAPTAEDLD